MLIVKRNKSDSLPASPASPHKPRQWIAEKHFSVTPPDELAARANNGCIPTDWADTCCNFRIKTLWIGIRSSNKDT